MEVPREGIMSVVRKSYTKKSMKEFFKLPDLCHMGFQKKIMRGRVPTFIFVCHTVLFPGRKTQKLVFQIWLLWIDFENMKTWTSQTIILENMYKFVVEHKGKHGNVMRISWLMCFNIWTFQLGMFLLELLRNIFIWVLWRSVS